MLDRAIADRASDQKNLMMQCLTEGSAGFAGILAKLRWNVGLGSLTCKRFASDRLPAFACIVMYQAAATPLMGGALAPWMEVA
jgi:hypothetical protein